MLPFQVMRMRSPAAAGGVPIGTPTTLSPNYTYGSTLSNGNRTVTHDATSNDRHSASIDAKLTGLHYFEMTVDNVGTGTGAVGIAVGDWSVRLDANISSSGTFFASNGEVYIGPNTQGSISSAWNSGINIGVKVDAAARQVSFRLNGGSWEGPYTINGTQPIQVFAYLRRNGGQLTFNFGQSAFAYSVPSGYTAGWEKNATYNATIWRARTLLGSGLGQNIAEIAMRLTAGGADQIGGGTAAASSEFSPPTYNAAKAVDGNTSTFWSSNSEQDTAWWQYTFASAKAIKQILERKRGDGNAQQVLNRVYLYSSDGTIFYPAAQFPGLSWTNGEQKTFAVADG